jgi:hypothetical protein
MPTTWALTKCSKAFDLFPRSTEWGEQAKNATMKKASVASKPHSLLY